ncbi:MAG TPA: hybrid sensor histidine kinase/response regulator, partial [Bacteroidetes bacterium]|nr:hybrid sensor histidine kinase/response regulator [Bacteroidota bacterium]
VLVLLFGAANFTIYAQEYHFQNYNVEEGLAQSQVFDICQDHNGYLWIATKDGGVSRFDGTNFKTFNAYDGLFDNETRAILEDDQHRLWIGHRFGGLSMYDGRKFYTFGKKDGLYFQGLAGLEIDTYGQLWLGTLDSGLYKYDGKKFIHYGLKDGLPENKINATAVSPKRNIYFRTPRHLFCVVKGQIEPLISLSGTDTLGKALEFGNDGFLYFNEGRKIYRLAKGQFELFYTLPGSGEIFDLNFDRKDRLWISTSTGLMRIAKGKLLNFEHQDDWWNTSIYMTMEDQSGNIWVGTEGGGISKFTGDRFVHFGTDTPIEKTSVFSICEIQPGTMWVGTAEGLYEFANMKIRRIENFPVKQPWINDMEVLKDGQILVSTKQGAFLYNDGTFKEVLSKKGRGIPDPHSISQDALGEIWLGSKAGVWMVKNGRAISVPYDEPALQGVVRQVFEDSHGTRWYLTEKHGLFRYEKGKMIKMDAAPSQNTRSLEIMEDKNGNIWVSTMQGLICYRDDGVHTLSTQDGLSANIIYILIQDLEGNIWVGTERGINRISIDANSRPVQIRTYGRSDGFIGVECNATAGLLDSKGNVWFGTILGMTCYAPKMDEINEVPPRIQIQAVQLQMKDVDWESRGDSISPWNHIPINPHLKSSDNNLRFYFSVITMDEPEKVRYQYRLDPVDEGWVSTQETNSANYSGLDYGSYTFKVRACNGDSIWTPTPATFSFSIPTPTVSTWWFRSLALAGIFFLVYTLVRLRINSLNRAAILMAKKVKERTEELETANQVKSDFLAKMSHEIRTPMNGVIGMTDLLQRTDLNERQGKFVENIRISGKNLLSLINDILDFSRIESGKIELENVPLEPRYLIEEVLEILAYGAYAKGLELMYQCDPAIRGPVYGDPTRLKQILVNLVGNAIKFTDKGRVSVYAKLIKIEGEKARIQISVRDSGIGIPKDKFATLFESFTQVDASITRKYGGTGLGLAISNTLAKKMGGKMWVESEAGKGAEFFFTFNGALSAPWKIKGKDHPAQELKGQRVAIAIADPEAQEILHEYLEHWEIAVLEFHSLEAISDALTNGEKLDYLLVDTRLFTEHHLKAAIQFARICVKHQVQFALICEPSQAIPLEPIIHDSGWLLSKPLKRNDLLNAMLRRRFSPRTITGQTTLESAIAHEYPLRILIAEDNPINMEVARGMLGNLGYSPAEAQNGLEVLDLLKKQTFDVILMDVQMPEMDGLQTTKRIISNIARNQRPLIVAMTANAMDSDRKRCLEAGMDTFISKPFVTEELIRLVQSIQIAGNNGVTLKDFFQNPTPKAGGSPISKQEPIPTTPVADHKEAEANAKTTTLTSLSLLQDASGGDSTFIRSVLGKLINKLPQAIQELRDAAAQKDWETLRATAHRTKSSAAYTGASDLKEQFRILEHIAREQENLDQIPTKLDELETYVSQVVEELKGHLANM